MDLGNPQIALRKVWICALCDNPRIACSIRGSCKSKGVKHGFGQTMDSSYKILYTAIGSMVLLPCARRCYYVHTRMEKKLLMLLSDTNMAMIKSCNSLFFWYPRIFWCSARIITCSQKKHRTLLRISQKSSANATRRY